MKKNLKQRPKKKKKKKEPETNTVADTSGKKDDTQDKEKATEEKQKAATSDPDKSTQKTNDTSGQDPSSKTGSTTKNEKPVSGETGNDENGYKVVEHVVKAQETIFRISMNYYNSQEGIALIKEWNGLTSNDLRVGQVLKIPLKE